MLGFAFYPLYKRHILRKIEKYEKRGLSYEEQLGIAEKQGGDKVTVAVIVIFLAEIVLGLMLTNGIKIYIRATNDNNINNEYSSEYDIDNYYDFEINSNDEIEKTETLQKSEYTLTYDTNSWESQYINLELGEGLRYRDSNIYLAGRDNGKELSGEVGVQELKNAIEEEPEMFDKIMEIIAKANDVRMIGSAQIHEIEEETIVLEMDVIPEEIEMYGKIYLIISEKSNKGYSFVLAGKDNISEQMELEAEKVIKTIEIQDI